MYEILGTITWTWKIVVWGAIRLSNRVKNFVITISGVLGYCISQTVWYSDISIHCRTDIFLQLTSFKAALHLEIFYVTCLTCNKNCVASARILLGLLGDGCTVLQHGFWRPYSWLILKRNDWQVPYGAWRCIKNE